MTREENIAKLAQLRSDAESHVQEYNDAIQNGKYDIAAKTDEVMTTVINEYTATVRDMCFEDCKNTENPMLTAVTALTFVTIRAKDERSKDEKVPIRSIVEVDKPIDLLKLHKYCGSIGADENWMHVVQKMNFHLTARTVSELCPAGENLTKALAKVNDSYAMSEVARGFDMGKNPVSKTNLLKTLQMAVGAMIGNDYKVISHDVNYLLMIYAKKNRKALSVTCANHSYFRNYIAEVCHHVVTGEAYEVMYKVKKDA